jgi:hypothetical protein
MLEHRLRHCHLRNNSRYPNNSQNCKQKRQKTLFKQRKTREHQQLGYLKFTNFLWVMRADVFLKASLFKNLESLGAALLLKVVPPSTQLQSPLSPLHNSSYRLALVITSNSKIPGVPVVRELEGIWIALCWWYFRRDSPFFVRASHPKLLNSRRRHARNAHSMCNSHRWWPQGQGRPIRFHPSMLISMGHFISGIFYQQLPRSNVPGWYSESKFQDGDEKFLPYRHRSTR